MSGPNGQPRGWTIFGPHGGFIAYLPNPWWRRIAYRLGIVQSSTLETRLVLGKRPS